MLVAVDPIGLAYELPFQRQDSLLVGTLPVVTGGRVTIEGQHQQDHRVVEFAFPFLGPPLCRKCDPAWSTFKIGLRVRTGCIRRLQAETRHAGLCVHGHFGVERRRRRANFVEDCPIVVLGLDLVTEESITAFVNTEWVVDVKL